MYRYSDAERRKGFLRLSLLLFLSVIIVFTDAIVFPDTSELSFLLGLLLMALAVYLVNLIYPGAIFGSLGFLHLLGLILYHGIGSIFYAVFSGSEYLLSASVSMQDLGVATSIAGIGVLAFAIGYCVPYVNYRPQTRSSDLRVSTGNWLDSLRGLSIMWSILVALYTAGILRGFTDQYIESSLFFYMAPLVLSLTILNALRSDNTISVQKRIERMFVALICLVYLFFGGERQILATAFLAALFLSVKWQLYKVNFAKIMILGSAMALLFVSLTIVRAGVGRSTLSQGTFLEKQQAYQRWGFELTPASIERVKRDLGYRLGTNVFLAAIHKEVKFFPDRLDTNHMRIPFYLVIPSFVWPQKLHLPATMRSVSWYFSVKLGLPSIDYLPSSLSVFYAAGGILFLLFLMSFLGLGVAWAEIFALDHSNHVFGIFIASVAISLIWIEKDIMIWTLSIRGGVVFLIVYSLFNTARSLLYRTK